MDCGRSSLVPPGSYTTPKPLNIEDEDLPGHNESDGVEATLGITSMSFSILSQRCAEVTKRLQCMNAESSEWNRPMQQHSQATQRVETFAATVRNEILPYSTADNAFHRYCRSVALGMMSMCAILLENTGQTPTCTRTNPRRHILDLVVDILGREKEWI